MTDRRMDPTGVRPSATEEAVLATRGGKATWVVMSRPLTAVPMVSIDENNSPGLIFDENGNIFYTEDG